jgi:hypothetical protein
MFRAARPGPAVDVSALAGPYGSIAAAADAASTARAYGSAAEQRLFHIDDIKKVLPRDSSALVLIAKDDIVRVEVEPDLRARLEALERRVQRAVPPETIARGH